MNSGVEKNRQIAITTSQPREHLINTALSIAQELNLEYITKNKQSVKKIREAYNIDILVIVREDRVQVITEDNQEFFFHPGLSIPRVKVLGKGEVDTMAMAMDLQAGDRVLDCTLGLANDAIVTSYIVGKNGLVVGLESSALIYLITKWGLKNYQRGSKLLQEAMKRIEVIQADYNDYLKQQEDNSFDIIYFDPMFKNPLLKSSGINNLRHFANYQELTPIILKQAQRVAKKRVVFKDRVNSESFSQLGFDEIYGGKYSSIAFGIIYC